MSLAFVFPGQGSQSVGMMQALNEHYPVIKQTFEEASDALNIDLWDLVENGPEELLNQTRNTQPAMLTAGVATWRVWQSQNGAVPSIMAGHSLGEYTALVCAGSIEFADAIKLVAKRGELMQEAVPSGEGAMAAILGLNDEQVMQACRDAAQGEIVSAVNFNAPGQVVIAGHQTAVDRAIGLAKNAGAKRAVVLPVSVPSHCALMDSAAEKLKDTLYSTKFQSPSIDVINNVDISIVKDPDAIRNTLQRQLFNPVRWVELISLMSEKGVDILIECGPGKVLVGLNKRINKLMDALPVYSQESLQEALKYLAK